MALFQPGSLKKTDTSYATKMSVRLEAEPSSHLKMKTFILPCIALTIC